MKRRKKIVITAGQDYELVAGSLWARVKEIRRYPDGKEVVFYCVTNDQARLPNCEATQYENLSDFCQKVYLAANENYYEVVASASHRFVPQTVSLREWLRVIFR